MNRIMEFEGAAELPAATEAVLTDNLVGLVVIRNVVDEAFFQKVREARPNNAAINEIFYNTLPELDTINEYTESWWKDNGYSDKQLDARIRLADGGINAYESSPAHIDLFQRFSWQPSHVGGVSMSLSHGLRPDSYAVYYGRKPLRPCYEYGTRTFDAAKFKGLAGSMILKNIGLRKVVQGYGDIVMFTQHPRPTIHKVESFNGRQALLADMPLPFAPREVPPPVFLQEAA